MNPLLLEYYDRELQYIREMGAEFAAEFPKVAGRLGLEGFECADPYVERLLEGFAFLTARIQYKLDAEFPRFTGNLLQMVYPDYVTPLPSMAVVEMAPDMTESSLVDGYRIPRGAALRSQIAPGDQTACEYRTSQDCTLWPIAVETAEYLPTTGSVSALHLENLKGVRAAIRVVLKTAGGLKFNQLGLDQLSVYLRGSGTTPSRLYEQLVGNCVGYVARQADKPGAWSLRRGADAVSPMGYEPEEALLPTGPRSFDGYRLLREYFAFPARFLFVKVGELGDAVKRNASNELELIFLLNRADSSLEHAVHAAEFGLHCTPAINLFEKRADRIHLNERDHEYQILLDRTRPLDFEIQSVTGVTGIGASGESQQEFLPFYARGDVMRGSPRLAYYNLTREPRQMSSKQRRIGPRSSYVGSEVRIALVDGNEAPYRHSLRQLAISTLCTNRDLPIEIPVGKGKTDFSLQSGAPVHSIRCVAGPTRPRAAPTRESFNWKLINHLTLNYLSLVDSDERVGAAGLRDLLGLYGELGDPAIAKQVEGVASVSTQPITRRIPVEGPISFGRGIQVHLKFFEEAFEGTGVFVLGAVLSKFFAKYASVNSFTETRISTEERGEIMKWPAIVGRRPTL